MWSLPKTSKFMLPKFSVMCIVFIDEQLYRVNFYIRRAGVLYFMCGGFPGGTGGKEPTCQCRDIRDADSILGLGRSPGGGHGNPLQYSCLENPKDRGAWQATVQRVTKSWTLLK